MDSTTLVVLAAGGLAVVCVLILLLAGGSLLSFFRLNFLSGLATALSGFLGRGNDELIDDELLEAPARPPRNRIREIAQSTDFDEALARHQAAPPPPDPFGDLPSRNRPITPQSPFANTGAQDPLAPPIDTEAFPPLEGRSRRSARRGRNEDEIFGGYLDEDGDGEIDF